MKKSLKYLFFGFVAVMAILLLLFSLYKNTVIDNISKKEDSVNKRWIELFEKSNARIQILKDFGASDSSFKQLDRVVEINYKKRSDYKNENSLDFVKLEFDVNQSFMELISKNDFRESELIDELTSNSYEINVIVKDYNELVKDYNKYLSVFPNFIFAKKSGFRKKIFFSMEYGRENEDPIIKSKEIPEWAKDTL